LTVAVATGQSRLASAAMRPKSSGSGRAVRSFTCKHLLDVLSTRPLSANPASVILLGELLNLGEVRR
jgi:hypothetical protein